MKQLFTVLGALLVLMSMVSLSFAQDGAFPKVIYEGSTEVTNVPGDFRLVTEVLEFPPGLWTPLHFHGGDAPCDGFGK